MQNIYFSKKILFSSNLNIVCILLNYKVFFIYKAMKLSVKTFFFHFLLILLFSKSDIVFSQINSKQNGVSKVKSTSDYFFEPIKICRWKDDAKTCVNLLFYDNCKSHRKISLILDEYGFKGTFPIIPSSMYEDSLKDISFRGHEIANHTFSHLNLSLLSDSTQIDFEIRKAKEMIENAFGIKCISFFEPGGKKSQLCNNIALNYNLFIRDYSEFSDVKHTYLAVDSRTILQLPDYLNSAINSGSDLVIEAHGIDGEGYEPISKDVLIKSLDLLKTYTQNGDIWLTTVKEGNGYENLFHELSLTKEYYGDTLKFTFKNFQYEKYMDLDSSLISIEIPYTFCRKIESLSNHVRVKNLSDKFVITTDLMRDTTFMLISKDLTGIYTDTVIDSYKLIYPNPVKDYLYLVDLKDISTVEIFNLEGKLQLSITKNTSKIDVSKLLKGFYLIKIKVHSFNNEIVFRSKFLKI